MFEQTFKSIDKILRSTDCQTELAYVAYESEIHTRAQRAASATPAIREAFADQKQLEFIDFILDKYVQDGVKELEIQNIKSLATLKYHSVTDAATVLGSASVIKETFVGFQKYLYQSMERFN